MYLLHIPLEKVFTDNHQLCISYYIRLNRIAYFDSQPSNLNCGISSLDISYDLA